MNEEVKYIKPKPSLGKHNDAPLQRGKDLKRTLLPVKPEDYDVKYRQIDNLKDNYKEDILRMFGEFNSLEVIKQYVEERWGKTAVLNDMEMLKRLCHDPRYKFTIGRFRDKYLMQLKDIAIYHKRIRLDDLSSLRERYIKQINELDDTDFRQREEFRYMARGLAEILSTVRDEVEGKGMNINVGLGIFDMGELDGKSDEELISRREELLKKAQRAIGVSSGRRAVGDNTDTEGVIEAKISEST